MFGNKKFRLMEGEGGAGGGGGGGGGEGGKGTGGAAPAWYDNFQDQGAKDWLKANSDKYPTAEAVTSKAINLEKLLGVDKTERGVIVPKDDADPKEWQTFFKKVSKAPDAVDGYKVPDNYKDNQTVDSFRKFAHENGMPPMIYNAVVDWYTKLDADAGNKAIAEFEAEADRQMNELKSEWAGVEYDKNIELGRRAAKQFIPHANKDELANTLNSLEGVMGVKNTFKFLANIGKALGEHAFEGGEGDGGGGGDMSPEAARVRIDQLKRDQDWQKRFIAGGAEEKAEWTRLHKLATGG